MITNDQSSVSGEGLWKPCNIGDDVVAKGVGEVVSQVINWSIASCNKCLDDKSNEGNLQHTAGQVNGWSIAACDERLDNKPNVSNLQHSSKLSTASVFDSLRESITLCCVLTTTGLCVTCTRVLCNIALVNDDCIEIVPEW